MHRPLRRFVHVLIWIVALMPPVAAVGYLLYANLLDPRVIDRLTGTYNGLYWDAAQLQNAYARFESQLLIYADGADRDLDELQLRYTVLRAKLNVANFTTQGLGARPRLMKREQADLAVLEAAIAPFEAQLPTLADDPRRALSMVRALRAHWPQVVDLSLSRHFADITERDAIRHDFMAKRRELFAAAIFLLMLSAAAMVLLVMNGYRRTRLILQQRALLEAEHEASRAAREAGTAKDAFLGMISHELRTPLHAIVSSIELLGFNSHSASDRKVIQRLETAARQLEAQMKDLTDYARLGAGKLELRHQQFDPLELLQSIVDENESVASARGLAFEHAWHGDRHPVVADPHRIRQIANNLVTNAIRYTEQGSVRIEFALGAQTLSIIVGDTGPGVPPSQIPLIFKEFTQLDTLRSRRYEGAGMGLAIVRGLVDLFGGTIETDSRVGEGTKFTVTVPVAPVDARETDGATQPAGGKFARARVLVVDDNPLVRESLCEMAEHMGYAALADSDADGALARLATHRCHVVLLDLHMPGRDGYAFLAGLEAGATAGPRPRVIAVSADVAALNAACEGGPFFECLAKPVRYEVLRAALQRALSVPRTARESEAG
ncbi:ATP-binding protein [Paraburkholderia sp.]|uniref:ATP-binding response regulator n=1 Tax=Paraburkholderia sp. TaxID=1926495 RepID=UPI0025FA2F87|nr:ATP-binding protein [Paraburkholderia sp.]